jgi:hypothetical protein
MSTLQSRSIVRVLRLALLPVPVAVALSFAAIVAVDHIVRPDRSGIESGGPAEFAGSGVIVAFTIVLQALWGLPSLLALDRWRAGFATYVAAGAASAILLSLAFAALLRAPQFGESLLWMFRRALFFFGFPLLLSYLLALIIRSDATREA